jgi:DNA primase
VRTIDFDAIRARHPLPEYCQKRGIELRIIGASGELVGLCPLHEEKSSSFTVYPDNHFYCFGCGKYGDVTDLEQALGGGTRAEAAARLGAEPLPGGVKRRTVPPIPEAERDRSLGRGRGAGLLERTAFRAGAETNRNLASCYSRAKTRTPRFAS